MGIRGMADRGPDRIFLLAGRPQVWPERGAGIAGKGQLLRDTCLESEKVTISENRFEGEHDVVEYPNADPINIAKESEAGNETTN